VNCTPRCHGYDTVCGVIDSVSFCFCFVFLWKTHEKSELVTTALTDGGVRYEALQMCLIFSRQCGVVFANKIYLALFQEGFNYLSGIFSESILSHKTGRALQIIDIKLSYKKVSNYWRKYSMK